MRIATPVFFTAIAGVSLAAPAQAGAERPVFVTVTGQSAIGFRLAIGATSPCDSSENRMMFDGTLPPGRYKFETGSEVVCIQYTSSAFPASDWSMSWFAPTRIRHRGPLTLTLPQAAAQ